MRFLRKGKVKEVYEVSEDELEFVFTDQISVFDKVIPTLIRHKGETLCRTSAYWFKVVQALGVRTHFLKVIDGNRMRVRRVQVIPEYDRITPSTRNFLIPLEVIARYYVAGSFHDRIQAGTVRPESVGFPRGHAPMYGEPLPRPFVEVTTKLDCFSSRRRHTRLQGDWSSDVFSFDLMIRHTRLQGDWSSDVCSSD